MVRGDPSMLRIRVLTALIIAGVFTSGAVVGAGIYRWGSAGGPSAKVPHGHGAALWSLPDELALTPEQQTKVARILDRHRLALETIVRESFPRVRAIDEQMQKEVKGVLTPEQQKKFEELKKRGPLGPTPTWQKRFDDFDGEPPSPPDAPLRTPDAPSPP
jgi:Spy/CpxP family protein refolding chaperone